MYFTSTEDGTLVLPAAEWPRFHVSLMGAWNLLLERDFAVLQQIHQAASRLPVERGSSYALHRCIEAAARGHILRVLFRAELGDYLIEEDDRGHAVLKAPDRKEMPFATPATTSFRVGYDGEIQIAADGSPQVRWVVDANPDAVEIARESAMGRAFFTLLDQVKWTADTGGRIEGDISASDGFTVQPLSPLSAAFGPRPSPSVSTGR